MYIIMCIYSYGMELWQRIHVAISKQIKARNPEVRLK